ncbi:MAG: hypothetical protein HQ592_09555 [Planctomycetes bacterium]|nr:hypothetical protein [Planctomycetota bacterium]
MMLKFFNCEMGVGNTAFGYPAALPPADSRTAPGHPAGVAGFTHFLPHYSGAGWPP